MNDLKIPSESGKNPVNAPIVLKSNQYWGKRSGSIHKDGTFCFKIKKWGNGSQNSGPSGRALRRQKRGVLK